MSGNFDEFVAAHRQMVHNTAEARMREARNAGHIAAAAATQAADIAAAAATQAASIASRAAQEAAWRRSIKNGITYRDIDDGSGGLTIISDWVG